MLTNKQRELYDAFYESTHQNKFIDEKTELLVGLSAAMAMNCDPCTEYYLHKANKAGIQTEILSEVLAKVMAVAAGQKKLQMQNVINRIQADKINKTC